MGRVAVRAAILAIGADMSIHHSAMLLYEMMLQPSFSMHGFPAVKV
jgi:hypothetical protein